MIWTFIRKLFSKKKEIKKICKNCLLCDKKNKICKVVILYNGEKINLPIDLEDPCFFEQTFIDPETGNVETFNEINQIRMWVEDSDGNPTDKDGTVKVEFSENSTNKL